MLEVPHVVGLTFWRLKPNSLVGIVRSTAINCDFLQHSGRPVHLSVPARARGCPNPGPAAGKAAMPAEPRTSARCLTSSLLAAKLLKGW